VRFGIDFGTTRTVVACADRGNYPVVDFVDDVGDARGYIPSAVAERDGELRFGFDATAMADDPSFTVVRSFKRFLSAADLNPACPVAVGSTVVPLSELLTRFLKYVREAVTARSSVRKKAGRDAETRVVVGVPANAFAAQRFVTLDAFRRAGFDVAAIVNEPSAAGFEYTHRHRSTLSAHRDSVVVYDLGGGTFDASLVRVTGHHHEVLATAGIGRLGGDDFDAVLSRVALQAVGLALKDMPARAAERWLDQCRNAKEGLNPNSRKVTLDLEAVLGPDAPKPEISVPVSGYYDACMPLIERSIEAMTPLISRAEAEESNDGALAGVYVVGGASELPVVGRALRERFGRRVHRSPYPSAAVAIGLSIAADGEGDFQLVDRASRTFAVFRESDAGQQIVLDPIFASEAVLPRSGEVVERTRSYRAAHNVGHFRFFECGAVDETGKPRGDMALCREVRFPFDASLASHRDLARVSVERASGEGPQIVERYRLDQNGVVHFSIRNDDAGYERSYRIGA
jgi:molecular chaperone DnaK (HSP70)